MEQSGVSTSAVLLAIPLFILYLVIQSLANCGVVELYLKFRNMKTVPFSKADEENLEGVTILRPLKGIDPEVEVCLESSLTQQYPKHKFEVLFCVESEHDPVIPVVQRLLKKYPNNDARLLVGQSENREHYGPNPKINNLAKGFIAAKNDIIWVMDSNVWALPGTLARSVYALQNSLDNGRPRKGVAVVHHLPLATAATSQSLKVPVLGAKLDEVFLKTSHAKFYAGFNRISVAPCVNGKSNMYRKSQIDLAVQHIGRGHTPSVDGQSGDLGRDAAFYGSSPGYGIRFFSKFIGEDNMIAIALWEIGGRTAMTGDAVLQPLGGIMGTTQDSAMDYILRRSRWLRVRKYMVLAATLLEPSTESIVAGVYGNFAVSVLFWNKYWSWNFCLVHFIVWHLVDWYQFKGLSQLSFRDTAMSGTLKTPYFAKQFYNGLAEEPSEPLKWTLWIRYWLLRELLALPIWIYAMAGTTIDWRGRPFVIKSDLTAEEI